ncbi:histidine kinase [Loktanella sp. SALINAS62]|nr:histidine kinase [Loktanella sp. SALINAS62]
MARILIGVMVFIALIAGIALYYLQVYAYYEEVPPDAGNVQFVSLVSGEAEPLMFENFKGIDSESSPLRYRACFDMPTSLAMMTETYQIVDDAEPRVAPDWFDCFDARQIGADLESGTALGFMGQKDVVYGIDRIVAVYDDGRAFAWHQINACGEVVFDGNPAPENCPPPPESTR